MSEGVLAPLGNITPTLERIAGVLEQSSAVVLTTHVTPDGDGLGSAGAWGGCLRRRGKAATVINCSAAPQDLRWLYQPGEFKIYGPGRSERLVEGADVILATDIGGSDRLGKMLEPVRRAAATRIVIDHHVYENDIFDEALIETAASSAAELTYHLLRHMGAELGPELAEPLYVGLVSDTGGFAYSATTARAHLMAATLVEAGVDPHHVWRQTHCQVPHNKMRFLGLLLARLVLECDGRVIWTSTDLDLLKRNDTLPRDAFEVVNHFMRVKGVEVGLFFMEISKTRTKVSLRSTGSVDVSEIARQYGGGGHRFAAGCTVPDKELPKAISHLLDEVSRRLLPPESPA